MTKLNMLSFDGQRLAVASGANQPLQFFDGDGSLARCAFEQVPVAGGGVALRWFYGDQYLLAHADGNLYGWAASEAELQDANHNGGYAFYLNQWPDGLCQLKCRDGRALGAGLLLNGQHWAEPLHLKLETGEVDLTQLHSACGMVHSHARRPQWEAEVHAHMVGWAFDVFGRMGDHPEARRLHELFGNYTRTPNVPGRQNDLMEQLLQGLIDADDENKPEYGGAIAGRSIFYKHFYDPRTKSNFLPKYGRLFGAQVGDLLRHMYSETAYTEALRYARQAAVLFGMHPADNDHDHAKRKEGAYALGLALHYVSDLSQPMHAANMINIPISEMPVIGGIGDGMDDWRHHNFETAADKYYPDYMLSKDAVKWEDIAPATFRAESMPVMLDTIARESLNIYYGPLQRMLNRTRSAHFKKNDLYPKEEVRESLQAALPHGQRACAAFLLLWSRLGLGHIWSGKLNMGDQSGWAPNFFRHANRNWVVLADSNARDTRFHSMNGNFEPDTVQNFVHGGSNCFEVPSVASDGGQQLVSAWHAHGSMSLWTGFATCADLTSATHWDHVNLPDARIKDYTSPTVFHIQGRFWMIWVDYGHCLPGGEGIYISLADINSKTWSTPRKIPGVSTTHSPAVLVRGNQLWLAWTGLHSDQGVYWTTSTDCEYWDAQQATPFVTRSGPGLGVLGGKPYLFWRAPNDEIHYSIFSDNQWSFPPQPVLTPDVWSHQDVRAVTLEDQIVVGWNNAWWPHRLVLKDGYA